MNTDLLNTMTILKIKGYLVTPLFPYLYIHKNDMFVTEIEIIVLLDIYSIEYTGIEQIGTMVAISYE